MGFSGDSSAEALIDVQWEKDTAYALATKADITALREVMATKADLSDLELRMTAVFERQLRQTVFQLGALAVAVGGLVVAALKLFP